LTTTEVPEGLVHIKTSSKLVTLKKAGEYQAVYTRGIKKTSQSFVVFILPNGLERSRFGLTIPRKLGVATVRNKIRRRMREMLRQKLDRMPSGFDVVVNPRRSAYDRQFSELRSELLNLLGVSS